MVRRRNNWQEYRASMQFLQKRTQKTETVGTMKIKMKLALMTICALPLGLWADDTNSMTNAMSVAFFYYPMAMPDAVLNGPDFGTTRDNFNSGVILGNLVTRSRTNGPTSIEIRDTWDANDITVSTITNLFLWRGMTNPPAPFNMQHGSRGYCPVLAVATNVMISLNSFSYRVTSGVALLGNQSSLAGLPYSVSRIGIRRGQDGILGTADDEILKAGESGTNMVDAILFIGGRVGAGIASMDDYTALNAEIGAAGTWATFEYDITTPGMTFKGMRTVNIYQGGKIPVSANRVTPFIGLRGVLLSVVGPQGMAPITLMSARHLTGPWLPLTSNAVEGTSEFLAYTGHITNDYGFVSYTPYSTNSMTSTNSTTTNNTALVARVVVRENVLFLVRYPSQDIDQDARRAL